MVCEPVYVVGGRYIGHLGADRKNEQRNRFLLANPHKTRIPKPRVHLTLGVLCGIVLYSRVIECLVFVIERFKDFVSP